VGRFTKRVGMGKNENLVKTENVVTYRKLLKYQLSCKRVHRMQACRIKNRVNCIILNIQTLEETAVKKKFAKLLNISTYFQTPVLEFQEE
jgi:predicted DNA binding protein